MSRAPARRLDDVIASFGGDPVVRVGAASAYVWIGRASEWDGAALDEKLLSRFRNNEAALAARLDRYPAGGSVMGRKVLQDSLQDVRRAIERYKPFGSRRVIEVWPSIMNRGTRCIKVEGTEVGPYWDESEVGKPPTEDDEDLPAYMKERQ